MLGQNRGKGKEKEESASPPRSPKPEKFFKHETFLQAQIDSNKIRYRSDNGDDRLKYRLGPYEYRPREDPYDDVTDSACTSIGILSHGSAAGKEPVDLAPTVERYTEPKSCRTGPIPDYEPDPQSRLPRMARDIRVKVKFRGASRTLDVDLHGTVLDMKKRFEADRKIPAATLMVEFGGRQLDDADILKGCGVDFEAVIFIEEHPQEYTHSTVNFRNTMTILVKPLVSPPYELTIPRSTTVRMLKDVLAAETNLAANLLALRHNGELLTAENEVLLDLGVGHGGILLLEEDIICYSFAGLTTPRSTLV